MIVDFDSTLTRLVIEELITQTVLPFDDDSRDLKKGDICNISFAGMEFKDYRLLVCNTSVTSLEKLSNADLFKQGFLYRPFYNDFIKKTKGLAEEDTIVKVDFKVIG